MQVTFNFCFDFAYGSRKNVCAILVNVHFFFFCILIQCMENDGVMWIRRVRQLETSETEIRNYKN